MPQLDVSSAYELGVDHIDQYFGLWAVEEARFLATFEQVTKLDLRAHIQLNQQRQDENKDDNRQAAELVSVRRSGQIAVIDITGTMMKRVSSLSGGASTIRIRQEIRAAAKDDDITGILLRIDSPGGTVSGTADLGQDVFEARKQKPVFAFIEDLGASAAFWVASQATKVFANDNTALVGSIGTFVGLYDLSGLAAREGIRPVVIKSGEFKGAGFPGTEITDAQREVFQELVDATQIEFNAAIARGRGISVKAVDALATGRLFKAQDALEMKLIDGIQSLDKTISQLAKANQAPGRRAEASPQTTENSTMTENETNAAPSAATIQELKASFPDATADFRESCLEEGLTLGKAKDRFIDQMRAEAQNRDEEIEKLKSDQVKPKRGAAAIKEAEAEASGGGDPIETVNQRVDALVASGLARNEAHQSVMRSDTKLREAYVEAYNAQHPQRRAG